MRNPQVEVTFGEFPILRWSSCKQIMNNLVRSELHNHFLWNSCVQEVVPLHKASNACCIFLEKHHMIDNILDPSCIKRPCPCLVACLKEHRILLSQGSCS